MMELTIKAMPKRDLKPGSYRGIRKIREYNKRDFVNDFIRVRTIMAFVKSSGVFVEIKRKDIWELAKSNSISYYMTNTVFSNKRTVMVIV